MRVYHHLYSHMYVRTCVNDQRKETVYQYGVWELLIHPFFGSLYKC